MHPAAESALRVVEAGWPVIPIRMDTDRKAPTIRWRTDPIRRPGEIDREWPRWAAVCGATRPADGRALVCVDADGPSGVAAGRALFQGARVATGREAGEHTWLTLGPDAPATVRARFLIGTELDWRGGDCYALLPGSLWRPVSAPDRVYRHLDGPQVADAPQCPPALLSVVAARAPAVTTRARRAVGADVEVRLDDGGAFARLLSAAEEYGRQVVPQGHGRAFVSCPTDRHPNGNRRPALLVTAKPGGVTLWCFARECPAEEIVAALGLDLADLYDPFDIVIDLETA